MADKPDEQAEAELLRQMMTGGETPRPPTAPDSSGFIPATYRILAGEEIANGVENLLSLTRAVTRTERRQSSEGDPWYVDATFHGNVPQLSIDRFAASMERILGVESGTIQRDDVTD